MTRVAWVCRGRRSVGIQKGERPDDAAVLGGEGELEELLAGRTVVTPGPRHILAVCPATGNAAPPIGWL